MKGSGWMHAKAVDCSRIAIGKGGKESETWVGLPWREHFGVAGKLLVIFTGEWVGGRRRGVTREERVAENQVIGRGEGRLGSDSRLF